MRGHLSVFKSIFCIMQAIKFLRDIGCGHSLGVGPRKFLEVFLVCQRGVQIEIKCKQQHQYVVNAHSSTKLGQKEKNGTEEIWTSQHVLYISSVLYHFCQFDLIWLNTTYYCVTTYHREHFISICAPLWDTNSDPQKRCTYEPKQLLEPRKIQSIDLYGNVDYPIGV